MTKYVLYATGEILLVVIGILIALQVNNWNENRKQRDKALAILQEIKENIKTTKDAIQISLEDNKRNIELYQYLYDALKNDTPYTTKMDTAFGNLPYWSTPYLTETAYQNIKNTDINIISNDTLRKEIIDLHEQAFMSMKEDWDRWEWDINQSIVMPFFKDHIQGSMVDRYIATPNDYETLKTNEQFSNLLAVLFRTRIWGIERMED